MVNNNVGWQPDAAKIDGILDAGVGNQKTKNFEEGSPGLVVMGDDSCSSGRWFESQRRIVNGHYFHIDLL